MKNIYRQFFLAMLFVISFDLSHAQSDMWTWMNGSSGANASGVYGTKGVASSLNTPPAMYEACEWTDVQGNFWLYGGYNNSSQFYSDLWKFNPLTNEWTWVEGPGGTTNQIPLHGTLGIASTSNTPGARGWGFASWIDLNGYLWLFGGWSPALNGPMNDLWRYNIATNEWTWMHGSNTSNTTGNYGTYQVSSPSNDPPPRFECGTSWTDTNNNLWLFGGGDNGNINNNDLWKYDIATNSWTWMHGSSLIGAPGNYGTLGVATPSNTPGSRLNFAHWKDLTGNLWLMGGKTPNGFYNDMWMYNTNTLMWTWVNGNSNLNTAANYVSNCTSAISDMPGGRGENRYCWTDACGKFWMFGGANNSYGTFFNDLWQYDPALNLWRRINGSISSNQAGNYGIKGLAAATNFPSSRWGGNAAIDLQGNLWLFGGSENWPTFKNDVWRFVPDSTCGGCINVAQAPIINLQSSDTIFCEKQCINFTDLSTNNPTSWQWNFTGALPSTSTDQNPIGICYNNYGSFDVTLIACNSGGCDTLTLPGFINEYQIPAPSITQSGDTLFSSAAVSYQWFSVDSGSINGATNYYYIPTYTGSFYVIVTDTNECEGASSTIVITRVNNFENPNFQFEIIPNPFNDFIIVTLYLKNQTNKKVVVEIKNTLGQSVYNSELNNENNKYTKAINLSFLEKGIYFVEVVVDGNNLSKKIMKQ
ncbi:MAG: T9SS type A sorting domain-containing protein [Bacteroidetes bacterium]|nr:T9SS type A sorting domain-containing protein [Bacteroidota bacterium]